MITKLSVAWRTFSNDYRKWESNPEYHPSAFKCLTPQVAQTLESMLQSLGEIIMDNNVNRELAELCHECDAAKIRMIGLNDEQLRIFQDGVLKHTKGNFIQSLETHLKEFRDIDQDWPMGDDQKPTAFKKLEKQIKEMKPSPPSYLLNFYDACFGLCCCFIYLSEAIVVLRHEHAI